MIKTTDFTALENIDLSKEISLVAPMDTPFYTYLLGKKLWDTTGSTIPTWREKTLDNTDDISQIEGSETDTFQESSRTEISNVCEIFKKAVSVSGTAQSSQITGVNDLFSEEINDRLTEMKINVEKKLINGVKDDASESGIRKMQGLLNFALAGQTVQNEGAIDEPKFKATIKKLWTAGLGTSQYIGMCNADMKEAIDGFYISDYHYVAQENMFGLVVEQISTNYGTVWLVLNRHMPVNKLVIFNPNFFRVTYLRKPFFEMLAKTGDSVKGQVITEAALKCYNRKAVAVYEDTTAPTLTSASIDEDKKIVTLTFSESIQNALADIATLKTKVTLATNGTTFSALNASDTVAVTDGKLVVTFASALSTATNKIKIAANSLKNAAGNKNAEVTTSAIDAS